MTFLLIMWMAWVITTDVIYAAKGQVPPRHQVRLARIRAGEAQRRYGLRGYLSDLADDALVAQTEHRRTRAARRGEPIDGMVDAVGVRRPAARPTPAAPTARTAPNTRTVGEVRGPISSVVHTDQHGYCLTKCSPTCPAAGFGWRCDQCGVDRHGFASEAEARADSAAHPCRPANAEQPTEEEKEEKPPQHPLDHPDGAEPVDNRPTAPVIPLFRINMPQKENPMTTQPVAEITGLQSAIAHAEAVAAAHNAHSTGGNEAFVGSLTTYNVTGSTITEVQAAQEASANAAALWESAAAKLREQFNVKQAYDLNPDAGSQAFVQGE